MKKAKKEGFSTAAIATGKNLDDSYNPLSMPIYQTNAFIFPNAKTAAARFEGTEEGFVYTRLGNPTQQALENTISKLEGGEKAVATASGQAATAIALLGLLRTGDHLIVGANVYGCTFTLIKDYLVGRLGMEASFVDTSSLDCVKKSFRPNTRAIFVETPTNPRLVVTDIKAVARLAHKHGAKLIVDNTFLSPYFQKPLSLGADLVIESCTKYIGGHGDTMAGGIAGSKKIIQPLYESTLKDHGGIISPYTAWLCLRGLKTLAIRMERHEQNTQKIARFLERHPAIKAVWYPGLRSHPQYTVNRKQATGAGGTLSFELHGTKRTAYAFLNKLKTCRLALSLGAVNTLICHPASTTHSKVPKKEREAMGISDTLIRMAVGLEDSEDLIRELRQALPPK